MAILRYKIQNLFGTYVNTYTHTTHTCCESQALFCVYDTILYVLMAMAVLATQGTGEREREK